MSKLLDSPGHVVPGRRLVRRLLSGVIPLLFVGVAAVWAMFVVFDKASYPALMVIEGRSEIVAMQVVDARRMDFAVANASVIVDDDEKGCVGSAVFQPAIGATVSFERPQRAPLIIHIDTPLDAGQGTLSVWQEGDSRDQPFESALIHLDPDDPECSADREHTFMLAGLASIGSDLGPALPNQPLLFLSGQVRTYGRAAAHVGLLPLDWGPMQPNALYLADEIPLPAGTRIAPVARVGEDVTPATRSTGVHYAHAAGLLALDLSDGGDTGFAVSLTANAQAIDLYLPAPLWLADDQRGSSAGEPDRLYFSRGAHVLNDPNIAWLAWISGGVFAVLLVLFGIVVSGWRATETKDGP